MGNFFKNMFAVVGMLVVLFILAIMSLAYMAISSGSDGALTPLAKSSDAQVGIVELEGEIATSKEFREKLFNHVNNKSIKAIVVRIDSPGGAVGASEEIYRYILEARNKKPVVCSLGNIAASGGLYSSMGCQKIVTSAGTMSGSIGVIMMMPNFSAVMEKVGLSFNIIKTGQFKDSGTPFREFNENDKAYLQGVAQTAYKQFVGAISKSRNIPEEKVMEFADGRVILGEDSVKLGLSDSIGGLYDAARLALTLAMGDEAKNKEPELIFPSEKLDFKELLKSLPQKTKALIEGVSAAPLSIKYQMR